MNAEPPTRSARDAPAGGLAPLRGPRLALALVWIASVCASYLAARELGLALVP